MRASIATRRPKACGAHADPMHGRRTVVKILLGPIAVERREVLVDPAVQPDLVAPLDQVEDAIGMMQRVPALDEESPVQTERVEQRQQSRIAYRQTGSFSSGVLALPSAISRARPILSKVRQSVPWVVGVAVAVTVSPPSAC